VHELFAPNVSQIIIGDGADINCGLCLAAMNRDGWGTKLFTPAQQALIAAQMSLATEHTEDTEK